MSPADGSSLQLVCTELGPALELLRGAGFRLDVIYPADAPHTAVLTHGGNSVRLTCQPGAPPPAYELPPFEPQFILSRAGGGGAEGRAGMLYRDLIPSRLGGRYIASHIRIPKGGAVDDWVHYHRLVFQMIHVRRGWVRLVYEDQGEPFVMKQGDLVLQPPTIRHQVLESSPGFEVVEISCPALHETFADHELALPNGGRDPARDFCGQRFLHHVAADSPWLAWNGAEAQETGVLAATRGIADARIVRPRNASTLAVAAHDGELVFGFVLEGSAQLDYRGAHPLEPADCFVIPPGEPWQVSRLSPDLRLLHVTSASLGDSETA